MDLVSLKAIYSRRVQYSSDNRTLTLCNLIRNIVEPGSAEKLLYCRKVLLGISQTAKPNNKYKRHIKAWFDELLTNLNNVPDLCI